MTSSLQEHDFHRLAVIRIFFSLEDGCSHSVPKSGTTSLSDPIQTLHFGIRMFSLVVADVTYLPLTNRNRIEPLEKKDWPPALGQMLQKNTVKGERRRLERIIIIIINFQGTKSITASYSTRFL
jgi:hypothetical protein